MPALNFSRSAKIGGKAELETGFQLVNMKRMVDRNLTGLDKDN